MISTPSPIKAPDTAPAQLSDLGTENAEGLTQASKSGQLNSQSANQISGQINGQINGQLIVLAGPSGVGKGTLLNRLLTAHPEVKVSVSATTRKPRPGEVDGQHYYFVSRDRFNTMVENGDLLEWAEFAGNCYGTPKAPIETAIARGEQVILEIELVGARQVRQSFPEAKQIFILPPSVEALENRIRSRGHDSDEAIAQRLAQAKTELAAADEFDLNIVNDSLEVALTELEAALF